MEEILATFHPGLFADKRVLISGGTSGIGLALAKGFAGLGTEVTATGASRARLDAARADGEAKGIRFELLDVRDRKAIDAFIGRISKPGRVGELGRRGEAREGI
jgi:NAD(P)-dependent dehydrogenase (short-subunit alcohol dehydrogenase family)